MQWESIFHAIGTPAIILAPDHTILSANNASCNLTGKTERELQGRKCYEIFHGKGATHSPPGCPMERVLSTKNHETADMDVSPNGSRCLVSCSPVLDEQGRISSIVHTATDISERTNAGRLAEERQDQFRLLFERSPVPYQSLDVAGRFLEVNEAWLTTLGYSRDEVIGKWFGDFISSDFSELFRTNFPRFQKAGETHVEFGMRKKDGSLITVAFEGKIGHHPDGSFRQTHCVFRDITRERAAEEKLRESEARYRLLAETLPDMVYLIGTDGNVLYVNPAAARQFRVDPADLVGKPLTALFPLEIAREHLADIRTVASTRQLMQREIIETFPTGTIHIEVRLTPLIDNRDQVAGVMGISRDITAAKEAENHIRAMNEELENRNRLLYTLLDTVPVGIFMVEVPSGKPVVVNAAATRLIGRGVMPDASRENLAEVYEAFRFGTPDRYPTEEMPIVLGMRGESHHIDDMEVVRPDGTRILLEIFGNPVYDNQNRVVASLVSFLDITDRKEAEVQREHLIRELARKNAELDRFTQTVSHDLKSPLLSLRAFIALLEGDLKAGREERVKIDIARMSESAERLETMITTLLDLSRSGRSVATPLPVRFGDLVRQAASLVEAVYRQRGVELVIAGDLPDVMGDRERLMQVMTNLLDNAAKFMGNQNEPRVEVGVQHDAGGTVFFVRDNGMGIRQENLQKAFGLYERFNPEVPGTGFGLAIVQRIIEAHGGKIWAESEGEGKRTVFRFTLPEVHPSHDPGPGATV